MWDSGATEVTMQGITADYLFSQHWRNIHNYPAAHPQFVDWDWGIAAIANNERVPNIVLFDKQVIVRIDGRDERITIKRLSIGIEGDVNGNNVIPNQTPGGLLIPRY